MRTLRKAKQKLKYALYTTTGNEYAVDDEGNLIYDDNGNPVVIGVGANEYATPVEFYADIAFASGEAEAMAFGISLDGYDSKLITLVNEFPITETSLIFQDSTPEYSGGKLVEKSADFRVVKIAPSENYTAYLLKRIEK